MTLLLVIVGVSVLWAQKTVTGTLRSADDGMTLPGVSIIEKGTANGTITDLDGKYSITVANDTPSGIGLFQKTKVNQ
ncbi:MAG: hypothetical protein JXR60_10255 [Bacteroidales bacterium]|nr:hypothetical protein [Bacteroidales bacterium]